MTLPAEAARLQFWRFNASENRLTFTTDSGVQPRAQLIPNPTRLVIDLPGTTLGQAMANQAVGGAVREVRVGQFDAQTTRLVVELNPGYTVDPQQVQIRGATPTQWVVQLPTPQRLGAESSSPGVATPPPSSTPGNSPAAPVAAATQLENVQVTPDGFFIRFSGASPQLQLDRSRDRRQITLDLNNTAISTRLTQRDVPVNRYGVSNILVTPQDGNPPRTRVTLNLDSTGADWQATVSNLGGIVVVPRGGMSSGAIADRPAPSSSPAPAAQQQPATVQSVALSADGTQLLVQSDRTLTYTTGWDRATAAYQITIPQARLAEQVTGPQLAQGGPLLRVRLRQDANDTVVVLVQPAAGVNIGDVNQPSGQLLALQLQRPVPVTPPAIGQIPVPAPAPAPPSSPLPRVPNSRIVVVVDPGHGGPDPGAVGINGLREKDIVLPIARQVAALLEQQGIQAVLTRADDRDLDLEPRVQIAARANANLFVSIHANAISLSRPDVNGIETYYYSDNGLRLAQVIHNSMVQSTGSLDRGVRRARFYVLRNTSMPAVLLETGFVTGRDDARRLADPDYRNRMAEAIARGILQYVQQTF